MTEQHKHTQRPGSWYICPIMKIPQLLVLLQYNQQETSCNCSETSPKSVSHHGPHLENLLRHIIRHTRGWKPALLNVRSWSNKTLIVNDIICNNKLDCIEHTETWLTQRGQLSTGETQKRIFFFKIKAHSSVAELWVLYGALTASLVEVREHFLVSLLSLWFFHVF